MPTRASRVEAWFGITVTYHDSCSNLRELKVRDAPRRLLAGVHGLALSEMEETEVCCGFGGAFSIKYPDIANAIVKAKVRNIAKSGGLVCSPATSAAFCILPASCPELVPRSNAATLRKRLPA